MPFELPTLGDLRRQVRDDISAHLPGADASAPNRNVRVLADAQAGLTMELLLYVAQLAREFLPDTSDVFLDRHADLWLSGGRKEATYAAGLVTVTGIPTTVVPALTRLRYGPLEYQTTAPVTISGPVQVNVEALDPGAAGNVPNGATMAFELAQAGVDGAVTVVAISGGADAESDDLVRARVLERIRNPPHGGDKADYVMWAKEVAGVTRAWAAPNEMGVGTVTIRVMLDDLRADNDGLPEPEDLDAVLAHLDTVRPVTVSGRWVVSPILFPVGIHITALSDSAGATKAAIEAELVRMFLARSSPGQTIYRSWVDEAISRALGEDHHETTFATATMPSLGHLPVLGTLTYGT